MEKAENIKLTLNLPDAGGTLSYSAMNAGEAPADIYINGLPVMGEIRSYNGGYGFFFVDRPDVAAGSLSGNEYSINLAVRDSDPNEIIEKSRRNMYTAFGLLLISLPFSFISYGRLESAMNSYKAGSHTAEIVDAVKKDKIFFFISLGASVALGINWGIRLGGYVKAANSLLPEIIVPEE